MHNLLISMWSIESMLLCVRYCLTFLTGELLSATSSCPSSRPPSSPVNWDIRSGCCWLDSTKSPRRSPTRESKRLTTFSHSFDFAASLPFFGQHLYQFALRSVHRGYHNDPGIHPNGVDSTRLTDSCSNHLEYKASRLTGSRNRLISTHRHTETGCLSALGHQRAKRLRDPKRSRSSRVLPLDFSCSARVLTWQWNLCLTWRQKIWGWRWSMAASLDLGFKATLETFLLDDIDFNIQPWFRLDTWDVHLSFECWADSNWKLDDLNAQEVDVRVMSKKSVWRW